MDIAKLTKFSIFPPDDKKQKIRIQVLFMSVGFYALCAVPIGLSVYLGLLPQRVMLVWAACTAIGNCLIYIAMRWNFNKRSGDPSLTMLQVALAIGLTFYIQSYAGPLRGAFLLATMLAFAFGCFKLTTRELLRMALLASAAYAATIPFIKTLEGARFNPAAELVLWVTFSVLLPSLAVLTGTFSDLRKKLMLANRTLRELNRFDGLTHAKNRAYFNERYEVEWRHAQRTRCSLGMLMIDIDHFKHINDTYGHVAGDACLVHVAAIIGDTVRRSTDDAFRYGGEEFAVLLATTDAVGAAHIAEIIRYRIETAEMNFNGQKIPITVSIGVAALIPESGAVTDLLIINADRALYQSKESGRNRVSVFRRSGDE
jgi:diguanylate cyclase (GGDEF)-like protein